MPHLDFWQTAEEGDSNTCTLIIPLLNNSKTMFQTKAPVSFLNPSACANTTWADMHSMIFLKKKEAIFQHHVELKNNNTMENSGWGHFLYFKSSKDLGHLWLWLTASNMCSLQKYPVLDAVALCYIRMALKSGTVAIFHMPKISFVNRPFDMVSVPDPLTVMQN